MEDYQKITVKIQTFINRVSLSKPVFAYRYKTQLAQYQGSGAWLNAGSCLLKVRGSLIVTEMVRFTSHTSAIILHVCIRKMCLRYFHRDYTC